MKPFNSTANKILHVAGRILSILLIVLAVFMVVFTVMSLTMLDEQDRNLFGYKAYIVLSDSMSATDFDAGDIVVIKSVDPSTLAVGDIVTYISQDENNAGDIITHKIRELTTDSSGEPGFVTYGTTTDSNDETVVTYSMVVGKYVTKISGVGDFLAFLRKPLGYVIFIFLPLAVIIGMQAANSYRIWRTIKQGNSDEAKQCISQREHQQEENLRIQQELAQLRAELELLNQHDNSSKEE